MDDGHGSNSASSSKRREKRKATEDAFFDCAGLNVSDSSLKKVLGKVLGDGQMNKRSRMRSNDFRFKHTLEQVEEQEVETKDGKVTVCVANLQKYIDRLRTKQPKYFNFLMKVMAAEQSRRPDGVDAVLYIDECVPGAILAPDNQRKAYCIYFAYRNMAVYRSIYVWWPLAVMRHTQTDKLPGGVAEFFTRAIRLCKPFLTGLVLDENVMIVTKTLFLIADEAALKACSYAKGSSGLRPCLRCDAFSREHEDVATAMGKVSIACSDFSKFQESSDQEIQDILQHLQRMRDTGTKAALNEAQKLLGWVLNDEVCFLDSVVADYLQPSRFHYDAMHCYWSNGQVNCEIGLFFGAAINSGYMTRTTLKDFFAGNRWKRTGASGVHSDGNVQALMSPKLLKTDSDYRGSATQCLEVLPLLAYMAVTELSFARELSQQIASLRSLWKVSSHILNAKNAIDDVHGLQALQQEHLENFIACYGPTKVRPKHHFAGHIETQSLEAGILLDCFPGERKNNTFKNILAPLIDRLQGFEKSILLRWLEHDAENLSGFACDKIVFRMILDTGSTSSTRIAKHVDCAWGTVKAGSYILMKDNTAFQAIGCQETQLGNN